MRRDEWGASLAVVIAASVTLFGGCGQPPPGGGEAGGSGDERTGEPAARTGGETTAIEVAGNPGLEEAADDYEAYVAEQTALLAARTEAFTEAVLADDVELAKELYAPARVPWERIEPIAAQLGNYDPRIDAREGDVPEGEWGGFHRIEKSLWVRGTTEGQEEYARQLLEDVRNLERDIGELELEPADLVTGSVELLNEVSAGKITGEEERYSHTDLYDIWANVQGSEAAFEELKPEVAGEDMTLANDVEEGFDEVYEELEPYRRGDGWVSYEELGEADRPALSQKVDALAEPLSRVGQVLEG